MLSKGLIASIPLLLSLLPSFGLSEPSTPSTDERDAAADVDSLQQLLNQVDPPTLHSLLHEYSPKKFKHGMFMEDRIAVEAIHRDDPPLAASIVSLAKRAVSNTTVTTPATPPASSTSPVTLGSSTANPDQTSTSSPPDVETSTDGASATSNPGSDTASPTATSTNDQSASSSAPSSGDTESSSRFAGSVFTFTNSYGVVMVSTAGGSASAITTASVPPSATESSSPISTHASTSAIKSSQTSYIVKTSILPNGSHSLLTSTAIVQAVGSTPTGGAGATEGTGTGTASPGLQTTNAAVRTGSVLKEMLCVVGGAVGVAMLMG